MRLSAINIEKSQYDLKSEKRWEEIGLDEKNYYLKKLRSNIESKGGKLLSREYVNAHTKVHIDCERGHRFWMTPNDVNNGYWCYNCYIEKRRERICYEIKKLIESKEGKLISIDFSEKRAKVLVECKVGHKWWSRTNNLKAGKWCLECHLDKEGRYNALKEFIESRGGALLSEEYINAHTHIIIQCHKGHIWPASPTNILSSQTWCPECKKETLSEKFTQYTINNLNELAEERGGLGSKCLENKYLGWGVKHRWKCTKGHVWFATPRNVKGRPAKKGTWCPICSENLSERVCRGIFEELLGVRFPKSSPSWLNQDLIGKTGGRRHLDGYNQKIGIAFEYNGIQHYKYEPFYHKGDINNFHKQQEQDQLKKDLCAQNNVVLIELGFVWEKDKWRELSFNEMEDYIREQIELKGIYLPRSNKKVNWMKFTSITHKEDQILKLLLEKEKLNIAQIARYLNIGKKTASRPLNFLYIKGILELELGKQNAKIWSIKEDLIDIVKDKISDIIITPYESRFEKQWEINIIKLLNKYSTLTTKEVSEKLNLSSATASKYLKTLELKGFITHKRRLGKDKSHPKVWFIKDQNVIKKMF